MGTRVKSWKELFSWLEKIPRCWGTIGKGLTCLYPSLNLSFNERKSDPTCQKLHLKRNSGQDTEGSALNEFKLLGILWCYWIWWLWSQPCGTPQSRGHELHHQKRLELMPEERRKSAENSATNPQIPTRSRTPWSMVLKAFAR